MKRNITKSDFRDAFQKTGRGEQFSYDGLGALFDSLEEYEESTGEEIELDVIALCCDFSEYDSIEECATDYDLESDNLLEELQNRTSVIEIENSDKIIIQSY